MPRPKNPLGDPVSVQKRGEFLDIRYYPNGIVGDPSERRWLGTKFPLDTAEEVIQTVAEQLRASLIAYRSAHGQGTVDELRAVTTREAVDIFVRSVERNGTTPVGTSKAIWCGAPSPEGRLRSLSKTGRDQSIQDDRSTNCSRREG